MIDTASIRLAIACCALLLLAPVAALRAGEEEKPPPPFKAGEKAFKAGKFEEAATHFEEELTAKPYNLEALLYLGEAMEELERVDEAAGYYQVLMDRARARAEVDRDAKKLYAKAKGKVRRYDESEKIVTDLVRDYSRAAPLVGRDLARENDQKLLEDLYTQYLRLNPGDKRTIDKIRKMHEVAHELPEMEAPRGYDVLWNGLDWRDMEVNTGNWHVEEERIMVGEHGRLTIPKRYKSYRLRMVYKTIQSKDDRHGHASLRIHDSPEIRHSGATLTLTGANAGMVSHWHAEPDPEFVRKMKEGDREWAEFVKEPPYNDKDWNELELTVKEHEIEVELNGEVVYRNQEKTLIRGFDRKNDKGFPGQIQLHSGQRIYVKEMVIKGR